MLRTQGLIVLLPGSGKLLKALITDLGLVKLLSVAGELMENDVAIPLFGNALPRLVQGFGHCDKVGELHGQIDLSMSMWISSLTPLLQYVDV